jgi:hypothetical protein
LLLSARKWLIIPKLHLIPKGTPRKRCGSDTCPNVI